MILSDLNFPASSMPKMCVKGDAEAADEDADGECDGDGEQGVGDEADDYENLVG